MEISSRSSIRALVLACALTACGPVPQLAPRPTVSSTRDFAPPTARIEDLLVARVPGIQVTGQGDDLSVRFRAPSTLLGSAEALVVIDGVPLPGGSRALALLAPADVQRIDVLKDPASTALYGTRGANGVLVVTTRRAR